MKRQRRTLKDVLGRPLRHRGWGGNLKLRDKRLEQEIAARGEMFTHSMADAKFGDGEVEIDYSLLELMEKER